MKQYLYVPLLLLTVVIISCKKDLHPEKGISVSNGNLVMPEGTASAANRAAFAKILAKAMSDLVIRNFIKAEALKQVDKDHDVVYHLSKKILLENGKTFEAQLSNYAETPELLQSIVDAMPLLTIFVPTTPDFSPGTWNTSQQIPIVAVRNTEDKAARKKIPAYDARQQLLELDYGTVPTVPVIVVKENERMSIGTTSADARKVLPVGYAGTKALVFRDRSFDGRTMPPSTERTARYDLFDPKVTYAYERNLESPRDYIYYGIDPSTGVNQGPFNNRYAEFLTSIKVNDYNSRPQIEDFTDGALEFQVNFLFLKTGGGSLTIMKNFPCLATDLFEVVPPRVFEPGPPKYYVKTYLLPTPIEINAWDMQEYGNTWKVTALEYDPGSETTITTNVTSTFGWNFGLDVGGEIKAVKIGVKFGLSQTTQRSETMTFKVTGTSDLLGEALLEFDTPIILSTINIARPPNFLKGGITREINLGKVSLSIEPKQRF
jgi:hypothetical protein